MVDRQVSIFLFKAVGIIAFTSALLPMFSTISITEAISIGIVLTIVSYIVGDLLILPRHGNMAATGVDVATAAVVIWGMTWILGQPGIMLSGLLITAIAIGGIEWFFHGFLLKAVLRTEETPET